MDIRKASILASVVLVLAIGGLVITTDSGTNTPMENEQPNTEEPEVNPFPDSFELSDEGLVVDKQQFLNSHQSYLEERSLVATFNQPSGERTIQKSDTTVLLQRDGTNSVTQYSNGEYTLTRQETGSRVSYDADSTTLSSQTYTATTLIENILSNTNIVDYQRTERGLLIRMSTSQNIPSLATVYGMSNIQSLQSTMTVDRSGHVRSMNVSVTGEDEFGVPNFAEESYQISGIGTTTVQEPSWVQMAESQTTLVKGTLNRETDRLSVEHAGLATIPPEATITVSESGRGTTDIQMPERFSEGDILYLVPTEDGGWTATFSDPQEGDRILRETVTVSVSNGGTQMFDISFEQ